MRIKYLGHSAVLFENNKFKCLIDPFLKGNPSYIKDESDIKGVTHIFITHAHGDHIGDSIDIARKNDSLIICNAEIRNILATKHNDLRFHPMHIGGTHSFEFGRVKMTPALHGSGYYEDGKMYDGGSAGGYVIEMDNIKLYHTGDTGLTYDMKLLEEEKIDIAFIPIGGNYTMDINDAVRAVKFINPKTVVPMHYNTFPLINADPIEFKNKLPDYKIIILNSSDSITL